MYNKVATILTLIVVNLIILANVVIPHHHHHDSEVCITVAHCHSEDDSFGHSKESHKHDSDKPIACGLNQIYVIPSDNIKHYYPNLLSFCDIYQLPIYLAIILSDELHETLSNSQFVLHRNILYSFHDFIKTSKGLRAPPLV